MLGVLQRVWPWALIVLAAAYLYRSTTPRVDLSKTYGQAPDFALADLDGSMFRLSEQRGKVVVLNFWATWCPPCRMEIPGFIDLQREYGDEVVFVGVALDQDGSESVGPYAAEKGVNYAVLPDGFPAARAFGGIASLPTTFIIDRQGQIRFKHEGLLLTGNLRPALDALRRES